MMQMLNRSIRGGVFVFFQQGVDPSVQYYTISYLNNRVLALDNVPRIMNLIRIFNVIMGCPYHDENFE